MSTASPALPPVSPLEEIEHGLDRILELRLFGKAPRLRSLVLVLTALGTALCHAGYQVVPHAMAAKPAPAPYVALATSGGLAFSGEVVAWSDSGGMHFSPRVTR